MVIHTNDNDDNDDDEYDDNDYDYEDDNDHYDNVKCPYCNQRTPGPSYIPLILMMKMRRIVMMMVISLVPNYWRLLLQHRQRIQD